MKVVGPLANSSLPATVLNINPGNRGCHCQAIEFDKDQVDVS